MLVMVATMTVRSERSVIHRAAAQVWGVGRNSCDGCRGRGQLLMGPGGAMGNQEGDISIRGTPPVTAALLS
jgi:hypothetical protein